MIRVLLVDDQPMVRAGLGLILRTQLRLMARGASNREIAHHLRLAETTIKTHIGAIFTKLGARDRAAAIVFAYDAGLVLPRG